MELRIFAFLVFLSNALAANSPSNNEIFKGNFWMHPDILEDTMLDVIGLLTKYGYPSESHTVQTEDGYLLTMHRITGGKNKTKEANKPVALLVHGVLCCSAVWISSGPKYGFGYLLADEGYDVWMANARGNYYSRKHISLNPDKSEFWKFSWNEIGLYDLPAMINYILKKTGQKKLHYVGHSQGTNTFFVMASIRPEFNKKIKSMHAFGPTAYMSHLKTPLVESLAPLLEPLEVVLSMIKVDECFPKTKDRTILTNLICRDNSTFQDFCANIEYLISGPNPKSLNKTMLPVNLSHIPAGCSRSQLIHYGQLYKSAKFRQYDYGPSGNLAKYGSLSPPSYPLSRVTAPVALYFAYNDWLVDPIDVKQLKEELGNPIALFPVDSPMFNHMDFVWSADAGKLVYNKVFRLMKEYDGWHLKESRVY